jgi:hypothetical protein
MKSIIFVFAFVLVCSAAYSNTFTNGTGPEAKNQKSCKKDDTATVLYSIQTDCETGPTAKNKKTRNSAASEAVVNTGMHVQLSGPAAKNYRARKTAKMAEDMIVAN